MKRVERDGSAGARVAIASFAIVLVGSSLALASFQRSKHRPNLVYRVEKHVVAFRPGTQARVRFKLRQTSKVAVEIAGADLSSVRKLGTRVVPAGRTLDLHWDGRGDDGRLVADGRYRPYIRVEPSRRSIAIPTEFVMDRRPPVARVLSIGPERTTGERASSEVLPRKDHQPARVRYRASGEMTELKLIRIDTGGNRLVLTERLPNADGVWIWDGKLDGRLSLGTFSVVLHSRDAAGNVSWSAGKPTKSHPFGSAVRSPKFLIHVAKVQENSWLR